MSFNKNITQIVKYITIWKYSICFYLQAYFPWEEETNKYKKDWKSHCIDRDISLSKCIERVVD